MHTNLRDVPYIDQYLGIWAMSEDRFWAGFQLAKQINLHMHLESDAARQVQQQSGSSDFPKRGKVAVIALHGTLTKHVASMQRGTSTVQARRQIRAATADPDVEAILLHVDSPGGTAAGTEDLADDVFRARQSKPVGAFIEDIGASAAFWVASQASRVSANASGFVGSIGTFAVVFDMSGAAAMEGIKAHVLRAGEFKGAGAPGTEITAEQLAEWQRTVDALNERFIAGVSRGRSVNADSVRALADGRVHIAQEAKQLGLIDAVESFDQALAHLESRTRKRSPSMTMAEHVMPDASANSTPAASSTTKGQVLAERPVEAVAVATFAEIKSGCPGADAEFICRQLEHKATLEQARNAWMIAQQRNLDEAKSENKWLRINRPGVEAVASRDVQDPEPAGESARQEWLAAVEANVAKGLSRPRAVAKAAKDHPELRAAMVEEANATC